MESNNLDVYRFIDYILYWIDLNLMFIFNRFILNVDTSIFVHDSNHIKGSNTKWTAQIHSWSDVNSSNTENSENGQIRSGSRRSLESLVRMQTMRSKSRNYQHRNLSMSYMCTMWYRKFSEKTGKSKILMNGKTQAIDYLTITFFFIISQEREKKIKAKRSSYNLQRFQVSPEK